MLGGSQILWFFLGKFMFSLDQMMSRLVGWIMLHLLMVVLMHCHVMLLLWLMVLLLLLWLLRLWLWLMLMRMSG